MIEASFRLTPGVGAWLESRLWDAGVRGWDDLLAAQVADLPIPGRTAARLRGAVERARALLEAGDAEGLALLLPRSERWRLYAAFLEQACFLDIETDGGDGVTAIGVLDASGPRVLVAGRDLEAFVALSARWKLLVTFNGTAFDVPVLRRAFPAWRPPLAHLDLFHLWRRLGQRGGLKVIEHELGIERPPRVAGLNGLDAIRLWNDHLAGAPGALGVLVEYNLCDAINLRTLADLGYNRMVERLRLPATPLHVAEPGDFRYDLSRLLSALGDG
jgi:uncharacterized protein